MPIVSDQVKYSRSTFVATPGDKNNIYDKLKDARQRLDSQIVLTNQKNPRDIKLPKNNIPFHSKTMMLEVPKSQAEKNREQFDSLVDP
jgi:hypothetical protein